MSKSVPLEELIVWQSARVVRQRMSKLAASLPKIEQYRLVDQLIRSSRSIPANIAEGFGRFHFKENKQYCRQARGSLSETIEHLYCALDEGYISEQEFHEHLHHVHQCGRLLNGYIRSLGTENSSRTND